MAKNEVTVLIAPTCGMVSKRSESCTRRPKRNEIALYVDDCSECGASVVESTPAARMISRPVMPISTARSMNASAQNATS